MVPRRRRELGAAATDIKSSAIIGKERAMRNPLKFRALTGVGTAIRFVSGNAQPQAQRTSDTLPGRTQSRSLMACAVSICLVAQGVIVPQAAAQADNVWGPWYSTQCRELRIKSPLGGDRVKSPQIPIPGRGPTQECKWERRKRECPKVTNRLTKPIKCFNRFQRAGWSINPPAD